MNILKFDFSKVSIGMPTNLDLLKEAKKRGFYNGRTPYNKMFNDLFFGGGKVGFKDGVDEEFIKNVIPYLKAFMGSFSPKHEEKEAICALILSEIASVKDETAI